MIIDNKRIAIISPCSPRSGSTLLYNAIMGFFKPDDPAVTTDKPEHIVKSLDDFPVVKSHNVNVSKWEEVAKQNDSKFYYISVVRPKMQKKLSPEYFKLDNFMAVEYRDILETPDYSLEEIVDKLYEEIRAFIPKEIEMDRDACLKRLQDMNKMVEDMKNLPFSKYEPFYHIHGHHRNRR